jgi:pyridoxal phosphate enzyme (YggS family)
VETIQARYENVLERISRSSLSVGRKPDSVRLVVVTKLQPVEIVKEVIAAGARYLGENYPDEAMAKMVAIQEQPVELTYGATKEAAPHSQSNHQSGVQWHIIGHVQSRKVRLVSENFDYLHSLDSPKLAQRLDNFCRESARVLPVLLEFNVSGEQTKSGWPAWDEVHWVDLLSEIHSITVLPYLRVSGLMTMAPFFENPEEARPYFKRLRKLQEFLIQQIPQVDWHELSMGMSGDFEVAVQEGATWVRIGQAILGPRLG